MILVFEIKTALNMNVQTLSQYVRECGSTYEYVAVCKISKNVV